MVSRPVRLGIGLPFGSITTFYPYPFFSDNCFVDLPVGRPLWREDGSVTYSEITDWSGHWGPITTHYRFISDCVPPSSPLMTIFFRLSLIRPQHGPCRKHLSCCVERSWPISGHCLESHYFLTSDLLYLLPLWICHNRNILEQQVYPIVSYLTASVLIYL
jgi:hypothetical protein